MVPIKLLSMPVDMPAYFSNSKNMPVPAGAILGGAAIGAVGNILGGLFGSSDNRAALKAQAQMQENAMNWQHNERLDTQSYNSAEAQKLRDWQEKMVNQQNEYNSIGAQVQRAIQAGVNPYSMISPTGSSAASAPSGAAAHSSGWPSVSWSPSYGAQNTSARAAMVKSITSGAADIASVFEKIASAKKLGVDTEYIERGMEDMLRNLELDANGQELANNYQQWVNDNADKLRKAQLDKLNAEFQLLLSEKDLNSDKAREIQHRIDKIISETDLVDAQAERLWNYVDNWMDADMSSQIGLRRSESSLNRARETTEGALQDYYDQQTETSYSQQQFLDTQRDYQNMINDVKKFGLTKERAASLRHFEEQLDREGLITDQQREALKLARNRNDWWLYDKVTGTIFNTWSNINGTIGSLRGR